MPPANLSLTKAGPESEGLVRNLFRSYVHDMAEWFSVDLNVDGTYSYDTGSPWQNGGEVYLARIDDAITGFAIAGPAAEWTGDTGVYDVREFFVLRRFRRTGLGQKAAGLLWDKHPGKWLVRVLEENAGAVLFWRTSVAKYSHGAYREESRMISGRAWRFFKFVSDASRTDPE